MFRIIFILLVFHTALIWGVHRAVAKFWHRMLIWGIVWLLLGVSTMLTVNYTSEFLNTVFGLSLLSVIILPIILFFYAMYALQIRGVDNQVALFEQLCSALGASKTTDKKNNFAASCSLTAQYKGTTLIFSHYPRVVGRYTYYHTEIALMLPKNSKLSGTSIQATIDNNTNNAPQHTDLLDEQHTRSILRALQTDEPDFWHKTVFTHTRQQWLQTHQIYGKMHIDGNWLNFTMTSWHVIEENIERARLLVEWLHEIVYAEWQ